MVSSANDLFTSNWNTYQKVVDRNYMHHKECIALLSDSLNDRRRLQLLDLGCGDGSTWIDTIKHSIEIHYVGYDLSRFALDLCRKNIQRLAASFKLKEGKMEELLTSETETFDIVYSSYAMHHLKEEEKKDLIHAIYAHTKAGGQFILTDIYRNKEMDRDAYISSYMEKVKGEWDGLTIYEKIRIEEHILMYDFPSTAEQLTNWCVEAGFREQKRVMLDAYHFFMVLNK